MRAPDFFWRENLTRWKGLNKVDYNVSQNCEINTLGLEPFQFLVGTRCDLERNVLYLLCALVISLSCLGCSPVHLEDAVHFAFVPCSFWPPCHFISCLTLDENSWQSDIHHSSTSNPNKSIQQSRRNRRRRSSFSKLTTSKRITPKIKCFFTPVKLNKTQRFLACSFQNPSTCKTGNKYEYWIGI